jgi:hypothetical protein
VFTQYSGVAGQFLVVPQCADRPPRQRMEPEHGNDDLRQQAPPTIAPPRMHRFVGKDQRPLGGVVTTFEIGRQHDPATPGADQRRPDIRAGGTQYRPARGHVGHRRGATQAIAVTPLREYRRQQGNRSARAPGQHDQTAPANPSRRTSVGWQHAGHRGDHVHQRR